jgi:ribosomal protein L37E
MPTSKQKPSTRGAASARTTRPGFVNRNEQKVLRKTDLPGNDHNQLVYILRCRRSGERYGANGSDIFQRRCSACGAGRPGLPIDLA